MRTVRAAQFYRYRSSSHSFVVIAQDRDFAREIAARFLTSRNEMFDGHALKQIKSVPAGAFALIEANE